MLLLAVSTIGAFSSARCPVEQKVVANVTSMSAVASSFPLWRDAWFRAVVHSREESRRRVVLFVDLRNGIRI